MTPPSRALAALAARQHGVAARRQLAALGFGAGAIDRAIALGRLHPVHRGVYAVGHRRLTERGRWMAAVLACGPDAVLSHASAARLWAIAWPPTLGIDVTVPGRSRKRHPGIRCHSPRALDGGDWAVRDGIPVTSVARTIVDLADARPREVVRAIERAERQRVFDLIALHAACRRASGRRGPKVALAALDQVRPEANWTRSELERIALDAFADLQPDMNTWVGEHEVDFLFEHARLIVEIDSRTYHLTPRAFEEDRERDLALALLGYRVVRVPDRVLVRDPAAVARRIRPLLGS